MEREGHQNSIAESNVPGDHENPEYARSFPHAASHYSCAAAALCGSAESPGHHHGLPSALISPESSTGMNPTASTVTTLEINLETHLETNSAGLSPAVILPEIPSRNDVIDLFGSEDFDDLGFLEDFLLPDSTMIPGYTGSISGHQGLTLERSAEDALSFGNLPNCSFFSETQGPGLNTPAKKSEPGYFHVLSTSNHDVEEFRKRLYCVSPRNSLGSFRFPTRSRIVRCILAYFDHFDPHTPIIQHANFSLSTSHPALVLVMMAIGAMYLSEHDFAEAAYELACGLLEMNPAERKAKSSSSCAFAPLQAMLLCVQFSALSGQDVCLQYSQKQYIFVSEALKDEIALLNSEETSDCSDWERWSFVETLSRLAAWTCILGAMLLANDPSSTYLAPYQLREAPLPLAEELWQARSASQWAAMPDIAKIRGDATLSSVAESLLRGDPIQENLSSFGFLSLVGWVLTYICTQEKMNMSIGPSGLLSGDFKARMRRVLSEWEMFARRRIRADRVIYRQNDALFTDCFPLLASAYYHLELGDVLRMLKETAARGGKFPGEMVDQLPSISFLSLAYRAILYAAGSWHVRAKQGIGHFNDTGSINYGSYYPMAAFETALISSWWLCISYRLDLQDPSAQHGAIAKPINEILCEAFAEVEDQGIPCTDAASRALSPLVFAQRCMSKSVYPFCRRFDDRINSFAKYISAGVFNQG